jgi:hypothetical protein
MQNGRLSDHGENRFGTFQPHVARAHVCSHQALIAPQSVVKICVCLALVVISGLFACGSKGALQLKILLSASDVRSSLCQNLFALDLWEAEDFGLVGLGCELAFDRVQRCFIVGLVALCVALRVGLCHVARAG